MSLNDCITKCSFEKQNESADYELTTVILKAPEFFSA